MGTLRPLLLLPLLGCAPASVSTLADASGADLPRADLGNAIIPGQDVSAVQDAPAATDAATPPVDAGALGEPAWVGVDVRTSGACDALNACGGDVRGTWDVAGVCIEVPIADAVMRCPGAQISRTGGRARGRVTFDGARARRAAEWTAEVEVAIPAYCAALLGGCDGIQTAVRGAVPDTTCAADATGACRCLARQNGGIDDGDGYSTSGTQIVSATLLRRWDYCVSGAQLRYRDASATGPREPGTITLARR